MKESSPFSIAIDCVGKSMKILFSPKLKKFISQEGQDEDDPNAGSRNLSNQFGTPRSDDSSKLSVAKATPRKCDLDAQQLEHLQSLLIGAKELEDSGKNVLALAKYECALAMVPGEDRLNDSWYTAVV